MTVGELIEELSKHERHQRVHVLLSEPYGVQRNDPDDSKEADLVTNEGGFILINSK